MSGKGDVSTASPAVPPLGTQELFTKSVTQDYIGIEQHSEGRAVQRKRPALERVSGAFVLGSTCLPEPVTTQSMSVMWIFRQRSISALRTISRESMVER